MMAHNLTKQRNRAGIATWAVAAFVLTAPAVAALAMDSPSGGDYLRGTVDITWERTFAGSDIDVWLSSEGEVLSPMLCNDCPGTSFAWDTTKYGDGSGYVVEIIETDPGYRRVTTNGAVTVDNTAPSTAAQLSGQPGDNSWYQDDVTVVLVGSDATSGVAETRYAVDGGAEQVYTGSFRVDGDGVHTVSYYSVDRSGNVEAARSVEVRIDGTAPAYEMVDPEKGNAYIMDMRDPVGMALPVTLVVGDMTVRVEASDATSGVDRVEFRIDGELRFVDTEAPYEFAWAAGSETLGDHIVSASAIDAAGNAAGSSVTVTTIPTTVDGVTHTLVDGGI